MKKLTKQINELLVKYGVKGVIKVTFAAEGKLKDGTVIGTTADEWAVGVDIYMVDSDGNQIPAPEGEHMLEDGRMVVVSPEGTIAEIRDAAPMEDAEMSEEVKTALTSMGEQLQAHAAELASLKKENGELKEKLTASETKLSSVNTELETLKKKAAAPSVTDKTRVTELKKETTKPTKTREQMTIHERIMHDRLNKN